MQSIEETKETENIENTENIESTEGTENIESTENADNEKSSKVKPFNKNKYWLKRFWKKSGINTIVGLLVVDAIALMLVILLYSPKGVLILSLTTIVYVAINVLRVILFIKDHKTADDKQM